MVGARSFSSLVFELGAATVAGCGGAHDGPSSKPEVCPAISDGAVMPEGAITCVVVDGTKIFTAAMWNECPTGDRVYRLNTSAAEGWWSSTDRVFHLEPLNGPAELAACGDLAPNETVAPGVTAP